SRALPRGDAEFESRDRSVSTASVARLERGAGAGNLRPLQRPRLPKSLQGIAPAAGLAAAVRLDGLAIDAASPLDRLGRSRPSAFSNAGWAGNCRGGGARAVTPAAH